MQLLLIKGANINAEATLELAAARGHEAIVQLLLTKGANINAKG